jgi:large subunit ribosomal protein L19
MANRLVESIEKPYLKKEIPQFQVGDTVDVATRIIEGDRSIRCFRTVIARKGGDQYIFTVRRIVNNEGVENLSGEFPVHRQRDTAAAANRAGQPSTGAARGQGGAVTEAAGQREEAQPRRWRRRNVPNHRSPALPPRRPIHFRQCES